MAYYNGGTRERISDNINKLYYTTKDALKIINENCERFNIPKLTKHTLYVWQSEGMVDYSLHQSSVSGLPYKLTKEDIEEVEFLHIINVLGINKKFWNLIKKTNIINKEEVWKMFKNLRVLSLK